jgi:glycosyltransferase involved in cell wall biosynthesis
MSVAFLPNAARHPGVQPARHRVAVLIPCLNEEETVATVVADFQAELPDAAIWVIDNGSTDQTISRAMAAGARIIFEPRKGKGFAIRAAFRDVEADVYVLADGDGQLPAASVHDLIRPVLDGEADMVVGSRAGGDGQMSPETINNLGNVLFSKILRSLLNVSVTDVLSGYRALSRVLVKSLPLASSHFEIEVELTIKTSQRRYRIREVPFQVRQRAEGTSTHLHVFRDGLKISWAILLLFRDYRPFAFFTLFGAAWAVIALALYGLWGGGTFLFVPVDALAIIATAIALLAFAVGANLSVVGRRFEELEGKVDMVTTVGLGRDSSED